MEDGFSISPQLQRQFEELGIDRDLTLRILRNYNEGRYDSVESVRVSGLPEIDGKTVLDLTTDIEYALPADCAQANLEELDLEMDLHDFGRFEGDSLVLRRSSLGEIGRRLYPLTAYGILNGGSATSYIDLTKNRAFNETIFDICADAFESIAGEARGKAKGLTAAFVHPDGTGGPSYVELKMRSLLIEDLRWRVRFGERGPALNPMFQMTSVNNDKEIVDAYASYRSSPLLHDLIDATGNDVTQVLTGVQPLIAAFTHDRAGRPKRLFTEAYGESGRLLPLPGGHGQNFQVLAEVYRELFRRGKRFVILGNVDNLGNTIDPVEIALLALSGKQAGFDFAFRTPVDVKGGILVLDQRGRLNCADIGPAISRQEVFKAEAGGKPILFNCATGVFSLAFLVDRLDSITRELPMRWSNQVKDAGAYSQAEQVTWEIIGMLDDFYIFGVDKYERFLAAKLLIESLMTSGIGLDDPRYPTASDPAKDLHRIASNLHAGLTRKLTTVYGMRLRGKRWVPISADELRTKEGAAE